jgi:hypothetical protein
LLIKRSVGVQVEQFVSPLMGTQEVGGQAVSIAPLLLFKPYTSADGL